MRWLLAVGLLCALSILVMCLTLKEYSRSATICLLPANGADSVAVSIASELKSSYMAKGAVLSAMDGDFSGLLAKSLTEHTAEIDSQLRSFNLDKSLLGMKKLCSKAFDNKILITYFSYDSVAVAKVFTFYFAKAKELIPSGLSFEAKDVTSQTTLPWRASVLVFVLLVIVGALCSTVACITMRKFYKVQGFRSLKDVRRMAGTDLLGIVENISPFKGKYVNSLKWKYESEDIVRSISEYLNSSDVVLINFLCLTESDIHKLRISGVLNHLSEECRVRILEVGCNVEESSPSYRFPDTGLLAGGVDILAIVHPPMSTHTVPQAYLNKRALNILVSDAAVGWPDSYEAIKENIPNSKLLVVGMPPNSLAPSREYVRETAGVKSYLPSEKHFRFIVLLADSYSAELSEQTCQSLYYSTTGLAFEGAESIREVYTSSVKYIVRDFTASSNDILSNLSFTPQDADAIVVLKAGCRVSKDFLRNISDAMYAGVECVQCCLKDKIYSGQPSHRALLRNCGRGISCVPLKYGFAATCYGFGKLKTLNEDMRPDFFVDYLSNTSVFFL